MVTLAFLKVLFHIFSLWHEHFAWFMTTTLRLYDMGWHFE